MLRLQYPPAFGYETKDCNAGRIYLMLFSKVSGKRAEEDAYFAANISKVLGYIPAINTLIGIARIVAALVFSVKLVPNKPLHVARGLMEILSLIPFLIIADIIVSIRRRGQNSRQGRGPDSYDTIDIDD
jgi:hypothetical protein